MVKVKSSTAKRRQRERRERACQDLSEIASRERKRPISGEETNSSNVYNMEGIEDLPNFSDTSENEGEGEDEGEGEGGVEGEGGETGKKEEERVARALRTVPLNYRGDGSGPSAKSEEIAVERERARMKAKVAAIGDHQTRAEYEAERAERLRVAAEDRARRPEVHYQKLRGFEARKQRRLNMDLYGEKIRALYAISSSSSQSQSPSQPSLSSPSQSQSGYEDLLEKVERIKDEVTRNFIKGVVVTVHKHRMFCAAATRNHIKLEEGSLDAGIHTQLFRDCCYREISWDAEKKKANEGKVARGKLRVFLVGLFSVDRYYNDEREAYEIQAKIKSIGKGVDLAYIKELLLLLNTIRRSGEGDGDEDEKDGRIEELLCGFLRNKNALPRELLEPIIQEFVQKTPPRWPDILLGRDSSTHTFNHSSPLRSGPAGGRW